MSRDATTLARDDGRAASAVLEQLAPSDPDANEKLAEVTRLFSCATY